MPIYAYKCAACGHAKDVLQKMSDDPLTVCPACGAAAFAKQVTAAGFQLKGSGWYVTDFRGGNSGAGEKAEKAEKGDKAADKSSDKPAEGGAASTAGTDKAAAPAPAPAAAPAPAPAASSTPSAGGS